MLEILRNIWEGIGTWLSSMSRAGNIMGNALQVTSNLFDHSIFPAAIVSFFITGLGVAMLYKLVGRS